MAPFPWRYEDASGTLWESFSHSSITINVTSLIAGGYLECIVTRVELPTVAEFVFSFGLHRVGMVFALKNMKDFYSMSLEASVCRVFSQKQSHDRAVVLLLLMFS